MPILRAVVELQKTSGIPADAVVNRFHFDCTSDVAGVTDTIDTALVTFYSSIDTHFSLLMATTGQTVTWYNLEDPEPRVPLRTTAPFGQFSVGGTALPAEVALCMSFQATRVSGVNQARRRNRVYLGTFAKAASADSTGRPTTTCRGDIASAGGALLATSDGTATWTWVTRSETSTATAAVDNGWVDDAWDTQRRRGVEPSARSTFS